MSRQSVAQARRRRRLQEFAVWRASWWREVGSPSWDEACAVFARAFRGSWDALYLRAVEYRRRREAERSAQGAAHDLQLEG